MGESEEKHLRKEKQWHNREKLREQEIGVVVEIGVVETVRKVTKGLVMWIH